MSWPPYIICLLKRQCSLQSEQCWLSTVMDTCIMYIIAFSWLLTYGMQYHIILSLNYSDFLECFRDHVELRYTQTNTTLWTIYAGLTWFNANFHTDTQYVNSPLCKTIQYFCQLRYTNILMYHCLECLIKILKAMSLQYGDVLAPVFQIVYSRNHIDNIRKA